jgi:hypothetical protein
MRKLSTWLVVVLTGGAFVAGITGGVLVAGGGKKVTSTPSTTSTPTTSPPTAVQIGSTPARSTQPAHARTVSTPTTASPPTAAKSVSTPAARPSPAAGRTITTPAITGPTVVQTQTVSVPAPTSPAAAATPVPAPGPSSPPGEPAEVQPSASRAIAGGVSSLLQAATTPADEGEAAAVNKVLQGLCVELVNASALTSETSSEAAAFGCEAK